MKLSEISKGIGVEVIRDGEFLQLGFAGCRGKECLTPLYDARFIKKVLKSASPACIITTAQLLGDIPKDVAVAVCDLPFEKFLNLHMELIDTPFYQNRTASNIHPSATIHPTAFIDSEGVEIGENTIIGPKAVVLNGTKIGKDSKIGPGCVIGYEGFEIRTVKGIQKCIPHGGGVVIGDRVDIQANCSVAKSVFHTPTHIEDDVKIGHLGFVSHGVVLGKSSRMGANVTISGSTTVGTDVWLGPGSQVSNGLSLGDGCFISIGAVVVSNVKKGERVSGNFAMDHTRFLRRIV